MDKARNGRYRRTLYLWGFFFHSRSFSPAHFYLNDYDKLGKLLCVQGILRKHKRRLRLRKEKKKKRNQCPIGVFFFFCAHEHFFCKVYRLLGERRLLILLTFTIHAMHCLVKWPQCYSAEPFVNTTQNACELSFLHFVQ